MINLLPYTVMTYRQRSYNEELIVCWVLLNLKPKIRRIAIPSYNCICLGFEDDFLGSTVIPIESVLASPLEDHWIRNR